MTATLCRSSGDAMTNAELKQALLSARPVQHNGIQYKCICEIVYKCVSGKIVVSAGLLDYNGNAILYALPEKVSVVDGS